METSTKYYQPVAAKFHVGPVDILSGLVKCPIIQYRLWDMGADYGIRELSGPVDIKVSFHASVVIKCRKRKNVILIYYVTANPAIFGNNASKR